MVVEQTDRAKKESDCRLAISFRRGKIICSHHKCWLGRLPCYCGREACDVLSISHSECTNNIWYFLLPYECRNVLSVNVIFTFHRDLLLRMLLDYPLMGTLMCTLYLLLPYLHHILALLHRCILKCFLSGRLLLFSMWMWSFSLVYFLLATILLNGWQWGSLGCNIS